MHQCHRPKQLVLRYVDCPSLDVAIENWTPEDPRLVDLRLEVNIGWNDWDNGDENIFFIRITTNELRKRSRDNGGKEIYLEEFQWPDVMEKILHLMALSERASWPESFVELRRRFEWYHEGSSWHEHDGAP